MFKVLRILLKNVYLLEGEKYYHIVEGDTFNQIIDIPKLNG